MTPWSPAKAIAAARAVYKVAGPSPETRLGASFRLSSLSSTTASASRAILNQDAWGSGTRVDGKKAQQFSPALTRRSSVPEFLGRFRVPAHSSAKSSFHRRSSLFLMAFLRNDADGMAAPRIRPLT